MRRTDPANQLSESGTETNQSRKDGKLKTLKTWTIMVTVMSIGVLWTSSTRAGSLDPTNGPGPTMHTLEEIYQKLTTALTEVQANQQRLADIELRLSNAGMELPADSLVIDLAGGSSASNYPVSALSSVPVGGWTDEYKTTKLVLRRIPAGTFTMGSPTDELGRDSDETQHQVTLTQDFYIGVFEVTQKQWERVMGTWPSYFTNVTYRDSRPVETVSYYEIREDPANSAIDPHWPQSSQAHADSFVGKLRTKTGLRRLDLPTDSQWEYACRAGTTTALNSGYNLTNTTSDARMDEVGRYWYNGGSGYSQGGDTSVGIAKVGTYLANAWGLYDMHGNVWEWCLDWYGGYPGTVTDPLGAASGSSRVQRGGVWYGDASDCRSASRSYDYPSHRYDDYGFRLSMTLQ